jgi:hypothetical protein
MKNDFYFYKPGLNEYNQEQQLQGIDTNNGNYQKNDNIDYTTRFTFLLFLGVVSLFIYYFSKVCRNCRDEENSIEERIIIDLKKQKISENLKHNICTICLDNYVEKKYISSLKCDHIFHHECINSWISQNSTCPLCRVNLL